MYLIVVYDVAQERVSRVHAFLKRFLFWRQNSVFEGEVTQSQYREIVWGLEDLIDKERDSVMIYKLPSRSGLEFDVIGIEKRSMDLIL